MRKNLNSLQSALEEANKRFDSKIIAPLLKELSNLPKLEAKLSLDEKVEIYGDISDYDRERIFQFAKELKPWRKGPFSLFGIEIESEWDSGIKYSLIEKELRDIEGRCVVDIGCNNGYYMLRVLKNRPSRVIGLDPMPLCKVQFDFLNRYINSNIEFLPLGIEHLELLKIDIDVALCLGVIYHRPSPIEALKSIKRALKKGSKLIVDTLYIDGEDEIALIPKKSYAKMSNVYFVPTINGFKNMLSQAGFFDIELLALKDTDFSEQKKSEWIDGESLESFLDPSCPSKTIEGYSAPKRAYFVCRR